MMLRQSEHGQQLRGYSVFTQVCGVKLKGERDVQKELVDVAESKVWGDSPRVRTLEEMQNVES